MKYSLTPIALAICMLTSFSARADDVSDLRAQIQLLSQRLTQMETSQKQPASNMPAADSVDAPAPVTIAQAPGWNPVRGADTTVSLYGKIDVTVVVASNQCS